MNVSTSRNLFLGLKYKTSLKADLSKGDTHNLLSLLFADNQKSLSRIQISNQKMSDDVKFSYRKFHAKRSKNLNRKSSFKGFELYTGKNSK